MFKKNPNASNLLYTMLVAVLFVGCGYHKTDEVRKNGATGEVVYAIWIYDGVNLLQGFQIPIDSINKSKKDSLNKEADDYIKLLESVEK